ncbi:mucin-2-like [Eriocheir sinensis]|uniref:mucin-2-like n=1 Tax=Eriocheir sinensis TaxID=95602 RepID=UPI0021C91D9A|nr:mucin-2-like [Eriocheir sinensis]
MGTASPFHKNSRVIINRDHGKGTEEPQYVPALSPLQKNSRVIINWDNGRTRTEAPFDLGRENGSVSGGHGRQTEGQEWDLDAGNFNSPRVDKSRPFVPFNSLTYSTDSSSESSPLFTWVPAANDNIRLQIANSKLAGVKSEVLNKPVPAPPAAPTKMRPSTPPAKTSPAELRNKTRPGGSLQRLNNTEPPQPSTTASQPPHTASTPVLPPPKTSQAERSNKTKATTLSSHQTIDTYTQTTLLPDSNTNTTQNSSREGAEEPQLLTPLPDPSSNVKPSSPTTAITTNTAPPLDTRTSVNSSKEVTEDPQPLTPIPETPNVKTSSPPDASLVSSISVERTTTSQPSTSSMSSTPSKPSTLSNPPPKPVKPQHHLSTLTRRNHHHC